MKSTLLIFLCITIHYTIHAQPNLEVHGDAKIFGNTPTLQLATDGIPKGLVFRFPDDNIYLSALNGNLHLSADVLGSAFSTDILINGTTGNIGIGVLEPQYKLDVAGSIRISDDNSLYLTAGSDAYRGTLSMTSNNSLYLSNFTAGDVVLAVGSGLSAQPKLRASDEGIGIILDYSPHEPLEVGGSGRAFFGNGNGIARKGLLIDGDEGSLGTRIESFDYGLDTGMNLIINTVGKGNVGIGVSNPTHVLHINGVGRSTQSTWYVMSDRRVKENIRPIENAMNQITSLNPVIFDWIESYQKSNPTLTDNRYGFIAQEVKQVLPQMVNEVEEKIADQVIEDFNVLNHDALFPLLVKGLQEQQSIIEKQNKLIQEALKRLEKLENQNQ